MDGGRTDRATAESRRRQTLSGRAASRDAGRERTQGAQRRKDTRIFCALCGLLRQKKSGQKNKTFTRSVTNNSKAAGCGGTWHRAAEPQAEMLAAKERKERKGGRKPGSLRFLRSFAAKEVRAEEQDFH